MPGPDPIRMLAELVVPRAVDAIDLNDVLAEIDLDELLEQLDLDALIGRVDIDAVLHRVDIDALLGRLDVDGLLGRVDIDALVDRVDVDAVLHRVDIDALVDRVDVDAFLGRVDIGALVDRVDVDAVLQRVDVDALVDRVDIDSVIDRVDVAEVINRVDIAGIVRRAQVDAIVTATAGGLGNRLLDMGRRQLVGLDIILTRIVDRAFRRRVDAPVAQDGTFTGQLAGGASRLAAFLMDWGIVTVAFSAAITVVFFLASLFVGHDIKPNAGGGLWHILAYAAFADLYQWLGLVIAGRTFGQGIAGLRVTAPDRSPLGVGAATRRVLVYPFSFILGLGLIGIVTTRWHRALHDIAAPSLVFYDWGDRPAAIPAPITRYLELQGVATDGKRQGPAPQPVIGLQG